MAEDGTPNLGLSKDVEIIREILFGEELAQIKAEVERLRSRVETLIKDTSALRQEWKASQKNQEDLARQEEARLASIQEKISEHEHGIREVLEAEKQARQRAVRNLSRRLVRRLERLKAETNEELGAYQVKQDNLVSSLAEALVAYRPQPPAPEENPDS